MNTLKIKNLNTSNVDIKRRLMILLKTQHPYLNTSNVDIKQRN